MQHCLKKFIIFYAAVLAAISMEIREIYESRLEKSKVANNYLKIRIVNYLTPS